MKLHDRVMGWKSSNKSRILMGVPCVTLLHRFVNSMAVEVTHKVIQDLINLPEMEAWRFTFAHVNNWDVSLVSIDTMVDDNLLQQCEYRSSVLTSAVSALTGAVYSGETFSVPHKKELTNYVLWVQNNATNNAIRWFCKIHSIIPGNSRQETLSMLETNEKWLKLGDDVKYGVLIAPEGRITSVEALVNA